MQSEAATAHRIAKSCCERLCAFCLSSQAWLPWRWATLTLGQARLAMRLEGITTSAKTPGHERYERRGRLHAASEAPAMMLWIGLSLPPPTPALAVSAAAAISVTGPTQTPV